MPVSGIVVTCLPGSAEGVALRLAAAEGVEIHGVQSDGQIVAVVESESVNGEVELVSGMLGIEGVLTVQVAYHNFEDVG